MLLTLLLGGMSFFSNAQLSLAVGSTAPNWTVTDVHGHTHTLYDITAGGQAVLIDFFFTTCGPCQATAPIITRFYQKYGCNEGDIYVISIDSGDTDAEVLAYEATYPGSNSNPSASGIDGGGDAVVSAYGPVAYPTVCLIGTDNKLKNIDIWPIGSIADIENAVSAAGITINQMDCALGLENSTAIEYSIYPNPSQGELKIKLNAAFNSGSVSIIDLAGKVVLNESISGLNGSDELILDLSGLENGHYSISLNDGTHISNKSFVLNR